MLVYNQDMDSFEIVKAYIKYCLSSCIPSVPLVFFKGLTILVNSIENLFITVKSNLKLCYGDPKCPGLLIPQQSSRGTTSTRHEFLTISLTFNGLDQPGFPNGRAIGLLATRRLARVASVRVKGWAGADLRELPIRQPNPWR